MAGVGRRLSPASGGALFTAEKFPKRAGGCGPRTPVGVPRRASQEAASRKPLRSTGLSRSIPPAPSRLRADQWNQMAVTATGLFTKAAQTAPERGVNAARGGNTAQFSCFHRRGAHRASAWPRRRNASADRSSPSLPNARRALGEVSRQSREGGVPNPPVSLRLTAPGCRYSHLFCHRQRFPLRGLYTRAFGAVHAAGPANQPSAARTRA